MSTTAEKLTYLGVTKEKIKDSINLTGANIGTNDTFRSYASKLKLGLIDIINNGTDTLYSNFPKVSGIGSNLSLTPTYEAPMKLNEIQGDTFQQTYKGNNLLNPIPNTLPNTLNGISVTRNTDGSLNINGTATSNWANITNKISTNLEPNTYKFLINSELTHTIVLRLTYSDETYSDLNILAGSKKREITTAKTIVSYYVYLILNAGTTYSEKVYLQLKLSSSSDDYEPYVGGTASPNPDYPQAIQNVTGLQNIEVCGKNLFDGELEIGGLGGSGEETTSSTNCRSKNYIEINSNETYTLSADTNENIALRFYDENKNFISSGTSAGSPNTFTTPNNAEYLRFMLVNNTDLSTQCQLEKGSTPTSYEEYKGQNFELNLGKQLLDESALTIGTFTYDDSGNRIITNNYVSMEFIAVKPNTTYTYSASTPSGYTAIRVASFTGSKTFINRSDNISFTNKTAKFTTSSNTYFIAILMYKTTNDADISEISNKQLEKGPKATPYSPYFTPIELNKIGNYQDRIYKQNNKWYIEKKIGKVVLDGTEDGWDNQSRGGGVYRGYLFLPNSSSLLSRTYALSNYFYYAGDSETIGNIFIYNSSVFIYTDNTTVQALKTWLSTHNTMVYYVLATPTDTLITNTELIEDLETLYTAKSQEGTTNISITSEDLEMILNISALRGDE